MAVFDKVTSKNIDEFAEWLDKYCYHDCAPWMDWFDKNYCKQCEGVCLVDEYPWIEYCWCEINKKCKFLPEMDAAPDCKQIVKMWLESEDDNGI